MVVPVKKIFGSVSILMACTKKKVFNYWISTKCNKLVTTSFLNEIIIKYRRKKKPKILVIFVDNATMHSLLKGDQSTRRKTQDLFVLQCSIFKQNQSCRICLWKAEKKDSDPKLTKETEYQGCPVQRNGLLHQKHRKGTQTQTFSTTNSKKPWKTETRKTRNQSNSRESLE